MTAATPGRDAIQSLLDLVESDIGHIYVSPRRRAIFAYALRLATKPADDGESVEPEELEELIADRSAGRAADLILANYVVTRRSTTGEPKR